MILLAGSILIMAYFHYAERFLRGIFSYILFYSRRVCELLPLLHHRRIVR